MAKELEVSGLTGNPIRSSTGGDVRVVFSANCDVSGVQDYTVAYSLEDYVDILRKTAVTDNYSKINDLTPFGLYAPFLYEVTIPMSQNLVTQSLPFTVTYDTSLGAFSIDFTVTARNTATGDLVAANQSMVFYVLVSRPRFSGPNGRTTQYVPFNMGEYSDANVTCNVATGVRFTVKAYFPYDEGLDNFLETAKSIISA